MFFVSDAVFGQKGKPKTESAPTFINWLLRSFVSPKHFQASDFSFRTWDCLCGASKCQTLLQVLEPSRHCEVQLKSLIDGGGISHPLRPLALHGSLPCPCNTYIQCKNQHALIRKLKRHSALEPFPMICPKHPTLNEQTICPLYACIVQICN